MCGRSPTSYVHLVGSSQERIERTDVSIKLKIKRQDKKPSQQGYTGLYCYYIAGLLYKAYRSFLTAEENKTK